MTSDINAYMAAVRFISWNVKGLNGPVKRVRIFHHLKHLKCGIAFLQETHLLIKDHVRLKKGWMGNVFHCSLNSKTCGTAILVHKKFSFMQLPLPQIHRDVL